MSQHACVGMRKAVVCAAFVRAVEDFGAADDDLQRFLTAHSDGVVDLYFTDEDTPETAATRRRLARRVGAILRRSGQVYASGRVLLGMLKGEAARADEVKHQMDQVYRRHRDIARTASAIHGCLSTVAHT